MPAEKIVLQNCGAIDPQDIETYLKKGGFKALTEALEMKPEDVIAEVKASGLIGRGGAGFPCGIKWELTNKAFGTEKFVICNADEGEMGTFKDRYILENDPFSLIEGLAIAAHAIGARKAYIYLRNEYLRLLDGLLNAVNQAEEKGFLKHVDIETRVGAGAYVCGEETALMESIEGRRGEARYKPPFPPTKGLWDKPTVINNVETLMNIPSILLKGGAWFNQIGTERSKGTKVFSVSGDVKKPGVYEVVMGTSLRELVEELAGADDIKMVQVGGAAGRILPYAMIDTPLSYETVVASGAVTVFDRTRDVIRVVCRDMEFLAEESCGKCSPCRDGTEAMVEILQRMVNWDAVETDIAVLEDLSRLMIDSSMCGLGQAAPTPVKDTLEHFRFEYENRIKQSSLLRSLGRAGFTDPKQPGALPYSASTLRSD